MLDYVIVFSVILIWLGLFVFRHYPGLLGIQPKAAAPVEEKEEFTLEYK